MSHIGFLDSETNLKAKQALSVTGRLGGDVDALTAFSGETSPASVLSVPDQHWLIEGYIAIFKIVLTYCNNLYCGNHNKKEYAIFKSMNPCTFH